MDHGFYCIDFEFKRTMAEKTCSKTGKSWFTIYVICVIALIYHNIKKQYFIFIFSTIP